MDKEVTDAWYMTSHLDLYHLIAKMWAMWWYFGFQLTDRCIQQCMHLETSTEQVYTVLGEDKNDISECNCKLAESQLLCLIEYSSWISFASFAAERTAP
jgi:hypothetical protein